MVRRAPDVGGWRLRFRMLGPLEVLDDDGRPLILGGAKQRALLAVLLLHPGQVVSADRLIDELWGEDPPDTARNVLQVYVANLRKVLEPGRPKRTVSSLLKTQPPGYRLDLDGHALDLDRFAQLVSEGRAALAAGQASEAATRLRVALGLWRGPALGDVALLGRGQGAVAELEERRLAALEERIQADLALGRHRELIGELETLVAEYPLRERLWAQLMLGLYRSGRQADALAAFQRARDKLVEELGIEPGVELRELEAQVLAQDVRLAAPRLPLPELPAPLAEVGPTFVGREKELAWLDAGLERAAAGRGVLRLVEGPAGAGKTRLAAELAHLAQNRHIPVRYAIGPAIPAELAAEPDQEPGPSRVAALVLDDLHAADPLPLDAIQGLVDAGPPVLVVGTYDPDAASPVQRAALDQLVLAGAAERRSLPALAIGDVAEIIRRYAADADTAEVRALADRLADATPGQVHQAASAWAMQRAADRVDTAVAQLPEPQRAAQDAREDLIAGVLELEHARIQRTAEDPAHARPLPICPYKGLAAYGPDDAAYFVGRERLVAETLARLVGAELLAVVGPSGSGKSSLVRAGLLPALAAGTLPGSERWRQVVLTPGDRPAEVLERALADLPGQGRTLLVVDQLEELFTLAVAGQRQAFVDRLVEALRSPYADVVAVVTLRSDYYGHCADHPDLAKLVQATTVLVGAMRPEELARAIEVPAELVGLEVEPGVTEAILADAGDQPGALPLVSTALLALWEHRAGRRLTLAGYAQTGGVRGAVARLADRVYDGFDPHQQAIARAILLRLTEPGEGGDDVRRRIHRSELGEDEATTKVLSALVTRRLLIADEETVEVAHEALLREWPRLRGWLEEDREGRRLHRRLTEAAQNWTEHQRDPEQLYRGARLAAALDWAKAHAPALNQLEREFLDASRAHQERQLLRARRTTAILAGLLVFALVVGGLALAQRSTAQHQATLARAERLAALATARAGSQSDLALLLAVEGHRLDDSVATRGGLVTALGQSPQLTGFHQEFGTDLSGGDLSPDGKTIAVGEQDGTLRLWDLSRDVPLTPPVRAHTGSFGSTFSPNGHTLVTYGEDGLIRLWAVPTEKPIGQPLRGHEGTVIGAAFSPDGHTLVTVGVNDGTLRSWAVPSGRPIDRRDLAGDIGEGQLQSMAISRTTGLIALGIGGGPKGLVLLVDPHSRRTRRVLTPPTNAGALIVGFSPDGKRLAANTDAGVLIFDVRTGARQGQPLTGHEGAVNDVRFSPDGTAIASGGDDGRVILWDTASGARIGQPLAGQTGPIFGVHFLDKGRRLASMSRTEVATWDLDVVSLGRRIPAGSTQGTGTLDASHDGRLLAVVVGDTVRFWDTATTRPAETPLRTGAAAVMDVAFSPDGRLLAASTVGADGRTQIGLWDMTSRRQVASLPTMSPMIGTVVFSPDGHILAADNGGGTLALWDVATRRPHGQPLAIDPRKRFVFGIAFSPDSNTVAAGGRRGEINLFQVASGRKLGELSGGHANPVTGLDFSPDASLLASDSVDGSLILWDPRRRVRVGERLAAGTSALTSLDFSPDGSTIATTSDTGALALWDVAARQEIGRPITAHTGAAGDVAFLAGGARAVTSGADGSLIFWELRPPAWEAAACALVGRNLTRAEWAQFLGGPYRRTCPQWPTE
jgi:WD40 repeat protein/DNA-binding SARP family transcriptional activator